MPHLNTVRERKILDRGTELHQAGFHNCIVQTGEKRNVHLPCGGACKLITVIETFFGMEYKGYRVKCHHHGKDLTLAETAGCTKKVIPNITH